MAKLTSGDFLMPKNYKYKTVWTEKIRKILLHKKPIHKMRVIFPIEKSFLSSFTGPLTTNYKGKEVLVGIVSKGAFLMCIYPSIFARVDTVIDWIERNSNAKEYVCFKDG